MSAPTRCVDCGVQLEPDEAEGATDDGRPRCDAHFFERQMARVDSRPPAHLRFLHSVTCSACGHDFIADSHSLAPEGCPECGHLDVARPPKYRTDRLLKAAHAHLSGGDERLALMTGKYMDGTELSTLRRERAVSK